MIIKCYAVYDAKVSQYRIAIFDIEDGGAMRQFSDAVNGDKQHPWAQHPEDYSLWYIGEFDTRSAKLKDVVPINLVNATAVLSLKVENASPPQ